LASETRATVFVIDDDAAVRAALRALFHSVRLPVETFESAEQFLEALSQGKNALGCLVLDVRMVGMSGLELQAHLAQHGYQLPVIIISAHADVPMAVRAMKLGAVEFLEKPINEQELLDRVQACLREANQVYQRAASSDAALNRFESLTARERQILQHVVSGEPSKVIAQELGISPRTVDVHRARIMEKLEVNSTAELVKAVLSMPRPGRRKL
jgi:RNA polymerase sigma factor (sigma-70 family)